MAAIISRHQVQARSRQQHLPLLATADASESTGPLTHLHYQDVVQRGLQALPLEQQAVVVLHDLEDLPQQEVAAILQIPLGTVKSRLHHARSALRQFLHANGIDL
jgi:RNA polymerase sigma-70 factor (ECF subfamily)